MWEGRFHFASQFTPHPEMKNQLYFIEINILVIYWILLSAIMRSLVFSLTHFWIIVKNLSNDLFYISNWVTTN